MRYTPPPELLTASLSSKLDSSLILLVNFRESDAFWKPVCFSFALWKLYRGTMLLQFYRVFYIG